MVTVSPPPTPEQERELLARIAHGDKAAMKAVYMAHAEAVQRFVRQRLSDPFEAADVVQEVMLVVWRSAPSFQGNARLRSWLLSIARNKVVDHIRKQSKVALSEPDETIPDDAPNPEMVVAAASDAHHVRACLAKLPDHQRATLHLAFFEDHSYPEISEIEGVPEGTIKTRVFHAKRLLMKCLSRVLQKV